MIHPNSIDSYQEILPELNGRHEMVYGAYHQTGSVRLTDRQVKDRLGLSDMNAVRPRITELLQSGHLREVGDRKCNVTNKTVRVTAINPQAVMSPTVNHN